MESMESMPPIKCGKSTKKHPIFHTFIKVWIWPRPLPPLQCGKNPHFLFIFFFEHFRYWFQLWNHQQKSQISHFFSWVHLSEWIYIAFLWLLDMWALEAFLDLRQIVYSLFVISWNVRSKCISCPEIKWNYGFPYRPYLFTSILWKVSSKSISWPEFFSTSIARKCQSFHMSLYMELHVCFIWEGFVAKFARICSIRILQHILI